MASKDNNIEYVIKAVDEFSKSMKDFQSYLKQTTENSANTEKSVKNLGDRLSGFGNIMTGFLRQVGVDALEFLKSGFESLISLIPQAYEQGYQWVSMVQQMQVETGMTAESVSTYAAVMHVMGIDTDSTATILARFGKNLIDSESKFKDLGIATRDVNGQMLTAEQVMENTRQRVAEIGPSFMSSAAAIDLFGRSGYNMLEFLNLSDEQFKALADDAANAGLVLSQDTIDAAHRFGIEMNRMNDSITGVQTSIFAGLEPSLEHFVDAFASFVQANLNNIVGFVVSVANFVMGVLAGLFGIDMNAPTLAGAATAGEKAPGGGATPTPAPKASSGGGGGSSAADAYTKSIKAQVSAIDDQIAALQKLGSAQSAANQQADLEKAISDAQSELTTLQSSVLNTYGLSDAERIKAQQKRDADVVTAEAKVADSQKKYADWGADQQRQGQIEQLQVIKAGLQDQITAQSGGTKAVEAGYLTTSAAVKADVAGLGASIGDFSRQAKDALAQGKQFSDWIKSTLIPAFQTAGKIVQDLGKFINDWVIEPIRHLKELFELVLTPLGFVVDKLGGPEGIIEKLGTLYDWLELLCTPMGLVRDLTEDLINAFGDLWDWLANNIPGLSGLRQTKKASGTLGGEILGGPGAPKIPESHYAGGGIVDRPTIAMIGEGGEREHVIPSSMLQAALNAAAAAGGGGGGSRTVIMIDKRVLGEVVDEILASRRPAGMARAS